MSDVRLRNSLEQRVDAGIAGTEDLAAHAFPPEVRCSQLGRREQQVSNGIDCDAEVLFGPGISAIVTAQAGLDMRHRQACHRSSQSSAKSAGRIALDDDELRSLDGWTKAARNRRNMPMRVRLRRAPELGQRESVQIEAFGFEVRMLPGQDDQGSDPELG